MYLEANGTRNISFSWMHLCNEVHHECTLEQTVWDCISNECRSANTFFVIMLGIFGAIISLSNILVIAVYFNHISKSFITGYDGTMSQIYYKLSLGFADLLMGSLVCTFSIANYFNSFRSLDTWQRLEDAHLKLSANYYETTFHTAKPGTKYYIFLVVTGALTFTSWTVSMYTLLACSIDRYYSVRTLHHSPHIVSKCVVSCIWIFSILVGLLPFMTEAMEYGGWIMVYFFSTTSGAQFLIMAGVIIPMAGMWLFNLAIYILLKLRMRRLPQSNCYATYSRQENDADDVPVTNDVTITDDVSIAGNSALNGETTSISEFPEFQPENYVIRTLHQAEQHFSITLAIIVFGFTISFLPMIIAIAMSATTENGHRKPEKENLLFWFSLLCVSNSFWNCIIYSARNKDFRYEAKLIIRNIFTKLRRTFLKL